MSESPLLRVELEQGVCRVTLDRPPANALNLAVMAEMADAIEYIDRAAPRVVILGSAVAGIFVAGADMDMLNGGWAEVEATTRVFQDLCNAWEAIACPTIAMIGGHAAGGGCELALASDLRVMARGNAKIGLPEVKLGVLASGGGTQRLARLLGRGQALSMLLRGTMVDADTALQLGLVTEVCEPDELDMRVEALAAELEALPPLAVEAVKRCVLRGLDLSMAEGLALERAEMAILGRTQDAQEGVRAFLEKRPARFQGR
jgi:enoyl-CoA hydratase